MPSSEYSIGNNDYGHKKEEAVEIGKEFPRVENIAGAGWVLIYKNMRLSLEYVEQIFSESNKIRTELGITTSQLQNIRAEYERLRQEYEDIKIDLKIAQDKLTNTRYPENDGQGPYVPDIFTNSGSHNVAIGHSAVPKKKREKKVVKADEPPEETSSIVKEPSISFEKPAINPFDQLQEDGKGLEVSAILYLTEKFYIPIDDAIGHIYSYFTDETRIEIVYNKDQDELQINGFDWKGHIYTFTRVPYGILKPKIKSVIDAFNLTFHKQNFIRRRWNRYFNKKALINYIKGTESVTYYK